MLSLSLRVLRYKDRVSLLRVWWRGAARTRTATKAMIGGVAERRMVREEGSSWWGLVDYDVLTIYEGPWADYIFQENKKKKFRTVSM